MVLSVFKFGTRTAVRMVAEKSIYFPRNCPGFTRIISVHKQVNLIGHRTVKEYSKRAGQKMETFNYAHSQTESDSDNERIKRNQHGESEFWRRKMRTVHSILDVNKDGVVSFDDFTLLADKFVSLGHLNKKSTEEFQQTIRELWESNWGEIDPYNLVTAEQYLEDMHHVINDKQLKRKVHRFLPYLFKAVDKDHDGEISVDEFKLFFKCLGIGGEQAAVSFSFIDMNSDGKLSLGEFVGHGRNFFLTENENCVSKFFWGPLVK